MEHWNPLMSTWSLKIGVVGFGSFGQFLAKTMIKQGHTLRATSRTDYSLLCLPMGIQFFRYIHKSSLNCLNICT